MQLTIINKITLGFGLFGCLLLLTSILSYFGLSGIKDSAQDVVEQKMPVQTSMVVSKDWRSSLSVITANGYHVENREELVANEETSDTLSSAFSDDLSRLNSLMSNNAVASNAVDVSLAYVNSSNDMYTAINERMNMRRLLLHSLKKS